MAAYSYDFAGRRVSKTVSGSPNVTTKYCYDGEQVIAEYDYNSVSEDYELARKFVYGPGIDEPIMMIDVADSNTVYYYHFDGLGSVAALSDVNSVIVERYSYDVFGEPNTTSSIGNPYMFTGRRYDTETSLYYYRARYYQPGIGRFLQADPIGYVAGLNLYSYCGNNPINFVDPTGLLDSIDAAVLNGSLTAEEAALLLGYVTYEVSRPKNQPRRLPRIRPSPKKCKDPYVPPKYVPTPPPDIKPPEPPWWARVLKAIAKLIDHLGGGD